MIWRALTRADNVLGSPITQLICFSWVASDLLHRAGFGFGEFFILLVAYVGFSTRIERIESAVAATRQGGTQ